MTALRYGIIGCGVIGPVHAQAISQLPQATLVGVCDVVEARAQQVAAEYGAAVVTTDYRALLDRADIDAVCVCLPHYLHAEVAVAAARAGKQVFCEKPVAIDPRDMDRMAEAAQTAGVQMGVCFQHRFDPVVTLLRQLIAQGRFGMLLMGGAHCHCLRDERYYRSEPWRGKWATEGGGILINQAIHTIDLMLWLLGEPVRVAGSYSTRLLGDIIEVEDTATGVVTFDNGASGHISATTASHLGWDSRLLLYGTQGTAAVNTGCPNNFITLEVCGEPVDTSAITDEVPGVGKACYGNSHIRAVQAFTDCVLQGTPYPIPVSEARKAAEVVLALYQSSRTRNTVELPLGTYAV